MKVTPPPIANASPTLPMLAGAAVAGAVLVAASLAAADLSPAFVYGGDPLARPVAALVALLVGAGFFYLAGIAALARVRPSRAALGAVLVVSLACQAVHLRATPMLEDDFYRYLLDGGITACGENPYVLTPGQQARALATVRALAERAPGGASPAGTRHACLADDVRWPGVLERVAYPDVRTIYPPLAQWWFAAVVAAAGPSVPALRVSLLAASALLMLALAALLSRLTLNPLLAAVWGWAPLVFKEILNSAHYDVVPTALLTLGLLAVASRRPRLAMLALGLAAAAKLFAFALLPLWLRALDRRDRLAGAALFVAGLGAPYVPFLGAGWLLWSGAWTFAVDWQVNAPVFAPAAAALIRLGLQDASARVACEIVVAAAVLWLGLRWPVGADPATTGAARENASSRDAAAGSVESTAVARAVAPSGAGDGVVAGTRRLAAGSLAILGVLLVCGPVGNPWYYCWLLPLIAIAPRPSWLVLTAMLPLYYAGFQLIYRSVQAAQGTPTTQAPDHVGAHAWLLAAEFGPFFVLLAVERFYLNRSSAAGRTSSPAVEDSSAR